MGGTSIGVATAAIDHASSSSSAAYQNGRAEGAKAGERAAQAKYEARMNELIGRLQAYHDFDNRLVGMYAIGLAVANADGVICADERRELDQFVAGCMSGALPAHVTATITRLTANKQDIDDIVDLIANADGSVNPHEAKFIARWQAMSCEYEISLG